MPHITKPTFVLLFATLVLPSIGAAAAEVVHARPQVSILTYNVHALPWPLAGGRAVAMRAIAAQLKNARAKGSHPQVVALQEAFSDDAKSIGALAGYRYMSFGPSPADTLPTVSARGDGSFRSAAGFLSGERIAKQVDSGLAIFSDYPIVSSRRIVYPICAGYDCLSAKGALAVRIALPGMDRPVVVVDTHLNSGRASGVAAERTLYAYRRQLEVLDAFVRKVVPRDAALFMAGDFNVGRNPARRALFGRSVSDPALGVSSAAARCAAEGSACAMQQRAGLAESFRRNKDWLLFRGPAALSIAPARLAAPFGRASDGSMLSDHIGISATYRLGGGGGPSPIRIASR